jgi:hypothetical protein
MFGASPFEPATWEEIEAALTEAIRSSAGGQMTRNAEVFFSGVCAKHLTDKLELAGFVFMRRGQGSDGRIGRGAESVRMRPALWQC